jgi:positive regulator of sigma E activity
MMNWFLFLEALLFLLVAGLLVSNIIAASWILVAINVATLAVIVWTVARYLEREKERS